MIRQLGRQHDEIQRLRLQRNILAGVLLAVSWLTLEVGLIVAEGWPL